MTLIPLKRVVLLVEDDPRLRRAIHGYLSDEDFHVETVVEYAAAVEALQRVRPTLICLDLTLPRESGYELCDYIRTQIHLASVPILVMSDRGSPEDMAHAEHAGANAYLKKPFTRDLLLKYVNTLLEGAHGSRPSVRRLETLPPPVSPRRPPRH